MPVTDIHAHILVAGLLDQLNTAGLSSMPTLAPVDDDRVVLEFADGRRHGPIPAGLVDVDRRLKDMGRQGVDVQVLSAVPLLFAYDEPAEIGAAVSRLTNDSMLEVAATQADHFQVLASLPMQDADAAVAELSRVAANPAVRGVQLATHVAGLNLDDPALEPVWEALEGHDMPAVLHPCPPVAGSDRLKAYHLSNLIGNPLDSTIAVASLAFGGVFRRHPALRVGLVHGGGYWPYQTGRWDHGFEWRPEARINIEEPPSAYYRQVYCDTLTHDRAALRFLLERVGPDRVMIGTDYPFDMAELDPVGEVEGAGLAPEVERAVLEQNAGRFLRPAF